MKREANTPWLIICVAVAMAMLRLSIVAADAIVLSTVYGAAAAREHLRIVGHKPELVVSNGDVLQGWGFRHYSIAVGLWLAASLFVLSLCWRFLLPRGFQDATARDRTNRTTTLGLLWALSLFFLAGGALPLGPALAFAALSLAAALWWARRPQTATGGAIP